jgi:hypothetical protein
VGRDAQLVDAANQPTLGRAIADVVIVCGAFEIADAAFIAADEAQERACHQPDELPQTVTFVTAEAARRPREWRETKQAGRSMMTRTASPKVYGVALGGVFLAMLFLNALVS